MIGSYEPYIEEPDSLEVLQFKHIIFPLVILGLGSVACIRLRFGEKEAAMDLES